MKLRKRLLVVLVAACTFGAADASIVRKPNYHAGFDAVASHNAPARRLPVGVKVRELPSREGYPSQRDSRLGVPTFLWAPRESGAIESRGPLKIQVLAEARARRQLMLQASELKLLPGDAARARLTELQDNGRGPVIARFQQMHEGREVFGRRLAVILDQLLDPVATTGYFAPVGPQTLATKRMQAERVDTPSAILIAFRDLTGVSGAIPLTEARTDGAYTRYATGPQLNDVRLQGSPRAKQVWFPLGKELIPAHQVEVSAGDLDGGANADYVYVISARDGRILLRKDLASHAAFSYRVAADTAGIHQPDDGPFGNARTTPLAVADPNVEPLRAAVLAPLVTLEKGPIAGNDFWLADGATDTRGNNVQAYIDFGPGNGLDPGQGDFLAGITGSSIFDYAPVPDAEPDTDPQAHAAIINLFYLNNWLHDWWYANGFDEKAGNAQSSNYGRGGLESDAINAEVDRTGTDNANMSTPPDGEPPRMQMYLFRSSPPVGTVDQTAPTGRSFNTARVASFGPGNFDLTADIVPFTDGAAPFGDACTSATNAAALVGKIALIDRGNCVAAIKVRNAQDAGAAGALVVHNIVGNGAFPLLGTDPGITIGSLSLGFADGAQLKADLGGGGVTVHLRRVTTPARDSALDNGLVAHEWFHYVSNRLVGDSLGLGNTQGAGLGEGWSDFSALMLLVRDDDRLTSGNDHYQGAYSMFTYVDTSAYFGYRRAPYSTDMAINPLTFAHIEDGAALPAITLLNASGANSEAHNTGEVWASVLWEIYAALLNDGRYSFAQAQDRMKTYVISGLKMTPDSPTFLEARNGILAAVLATDGGADLEAVAGAFAKRGMGVGAVAPARNDDNQGGVVESYVALAAAFSVTDAHVDLAYDDGMQGYCDADASLDPGETALLSVTVQSNGTRPITAPFTAEVSGPAELGFPAGATITFQPLGLGAQASGSVLVRLDAGSGPGSLEISLDFPDSGTAPGAVIEAPSKVLVQDVDSSPAPARTGDDMEQPFASVASWRRTATPTQDGVEWQLADYDGTFAVGTGISWFAPDNDFTSQMELTTPEMAAGDGFSVAFDHFFDFEPDGIAPGGTLFGYDGGVLEISVDGAEFQDAIEFGGTVSAGNGYNGRITALASGDPGSPNEFGRPGFVDTNGDLEHVRIDFGDLASGHSVRLRFVLATDESTSDFGWIVDNFETTGLTDQPFFNIADDTGICVNRPPHANAGPDFTTPERATPGSKQAKITLAGTALDRDGRRTIAWVQTGGPAVSLTRATTARPSFVSPKLMANTEFTFQMTVSDGVAAPSVDSVTVTVTAVPRKATEGGALDDVFLLLLGLAVSARRYLKARRPGSEFSRKLDTAKADVP